MLSDFGKQILDEGPIEYVSTWKEHVGIEFLFDVNIASVDSFSDEGSSSLEIDGFVPEQKAVIDLPSLESDGLLVR